MKRRIVRFFRTFYKKRSNPVNISAFMLALCIAVPASCSTFAEAAVIESAENAAVMETVLQQTEALWASAKLELSETSSVMEAENTTFLGNRIAVYEATENGLEEMSYAWFPVINGDTVAALSISDQWETGEIYTTLSFAFLDELQTAYEAGTAVALIYAREGLYLYSSTAVELLYANATPDLSRASLTVALSNTDDLHIPVTSVLSAAQQLHESDTATTGTVEKNCMVDIIKQGDNTKICWACTTVSIGLYMTDITEFDSGEALCYALYRTCDYDGGYSAAKSALLEYYDIEARYFDIESISASEILSDLNSRCPLYGSFYVKTSTSQRHASVIRGINISDGTFSVMDPQGGEYYTWGTYSGSTFSFVNETSGNTLVLLEGLRTSEISE